MSDRTSKHLVIVNLDCREGTPAYRNKFRAIGGSVETFFFIATKWLDVPKPYLEVHALTPKGDALLGGWTGPVDPNEYATTEDVYAVQADVWGQIVKAVYGISEEAFHAQGGRSKAPSGSTYMDSLSWNFGSAMSFELSA